MWWRKALLSLLLANHHHQHPRRRTKRTPTVAFLDALELSITIVFMIFHFRDLTFRNIYVESKQGIVMFIIAILCLINSLHQWVNRLITTVEKSPCSTHVVLDPQLRLAALTLFVTVCVCLNKILVSGHGLDPSLCAHAAHCPLCFTLSAALIAAFWFQYGHRLFALAAPHHPLSLLLSW